MTSMTGPEAVQHAMLIERSAVRPEVVEAVCLVRLCLDALGKPRSAALSARRRRVLGPLPHPSHSRQPVGDPETHGRGAG